MSKRFMILCGAALAGLGSAAEAQNQAVIAVQPQRYEAPECDPLRSGHFKVKSGATYVQSALGSASNRDRLLNDAERVLKEAITQDGQGDSPMAWYWLGRVYLYRGDVVGADSSLTHAERLAPECSGVIKPIKAQTASALMRPATAAREAGNLDSAMVLLRQVLSFQSDNPNANYELAVIYYNAKNFDSAAAAFSRAVTATEERARTDSAYASFRNQALFNLAAVHQNAGKHPEAIAALTRYLGYNPVDNDARRALANSLRATGMADSAAAVEKTITSVPGAAPATGASGAFNRGIDAFNAKDFETAAAAFQEYLAANPRSREALYNLASTYYAMSQADSLIKVGERLVAIDPLNDNNLRLLAGGYQLKKNQDQMIKYAMLITELPVNIVVSGFQTGAASANWAGSATGRAPRNSADQPIKPAEMTLVLEFLDAEGNVVDSKEVVIKPLAEGEKQEITVASQGSAIVAWKYRKK